MVDQKNTKSQSADIDGEFRQTLTALFRHNRAGMYRYACYRLGCADEADDVVQDVFLHLYSKADMLRSVGDWQSYLYRSLSNRCTDRLRRNGLHTVSLPENLDVPSDEESGSFEQEFQRINRLMAAIPSEQAEVIRLRLHGDLSFAEIARVTGCAVTTVQSRFQYGIEKIRKAMNNSTK